MKTREEREALLRAASCKNAIGTQPHLSEFKEYLVADSRWCGWCVEKAKNPHGCAYCRIREDIRTAVDVALYHAQAVVASRDLLCFALAECLGVPDDE